MEDRFNEMDATVKFMNGVMSQGFAGLGEVVELVKDQQELNKSVFNVIHKLD